jgi:hypothetical protein
MCTTFILYPRPLFARDSREFLQKEGEVVVIGVEVRAF